MTPPQVFYFNAAGRGEMIRLAFVVNGQKFEDIRFKDKEEWVTKYKPMLQAEPINPQAPALRDENGQLHSQSLAILQYVIEKYNNGSCLQIKDLTPEQIRDAQAIVQNSENIFEAMKPAMYEPDEKVKAKLMAEAKTTIIPTHMTALDKFCERAASKGAKYFFGDKPSYADIAIATYLGNFTKDPTAHYYCPEIEKKCPTLSRIRQAVESIPTVNQYYASKTQ